MQGIDEYLLAYAGLPLHQHRDVLFQQQAGLRQGLLQAWLGAAGGGAAGGLARRLPLAMKAVAPGGLQSEGLLSGMAEQLLQGQLEQLRDVLLQRVAA
ncbi:hypothetical protein D3C75_757850 [compost metagenome]